MELTIKQALQQAAYAHKKGELQVAERFYQAILKSQPQHPDANHNLGVLALSSKNIEVALPLFKTALEVNPKIEKFWFSYIDALIKDKQNNAAKQIIKQARKQGVVGVKLNIIEAQLNSVKELKNTSSMNPLQQEIDNLLELYQNKRYEDAKKLAVSLIEKFPKHSFSCKVLGTILNQTGKASEALVINQKSVQLAPQDADTHNNLGITFQELQRLEEAEESYNKAIKLKPDFVTAHNNLGTTLQQLGKLEEAEESYNQAIKLKHDYVEAHNNLGCIFQKSDRLEEAEEKFKQVIELEPDHAVAHNNLGTTLQQLGKLEEAEESYNKAIKLKPDYAESHLYLTSIKKFTERDKQYLKMLNIYFDNNISEKQRCYINFALAKACEDLGNFEKAFQHYSKGNVLRKKMWNYDITQDVKLFNKIKLNYPSILQNSLKSENLEKDLIPVFIVGMPRSGTSLVEQIISSHLKVTGGGELNFVPQLGLPVIENFANKVTDLLTEFRNKYLEKLQNIAKGNVIITDKMPQNFFFIGLIAAAFPEAKIIHVKRSAAAVCWSNYKQYFTSQVQSYSCELRDIVSYYKLYQNLMEFWESLLKDRIYNLDYELLIESQEKETHQLIDYLGLDWDEKCLSPQNNTRSVHTASSIQIRKKVYQGSSQQWKKYQPFLNGVLDGL